MMAAVTTVHVMPVSCGCPRRPRPCPHVVPETLTNILLRHDRYKDEYAEAIREIEAVKSEMEAVKQKVRRVMCLVLWFCPDSSKEEFGGASAWWRGVHAHVCEKNCTLRLGTDPRLRSGKGGDLSCRAVCAEDLQAARAVRLKHRTG